MIKGILVVKLFLDAKSPEAKPATKYSKTNKINNFKWEPMAIYVLNKEDLGISLKILEEALKVYPRIKERQKVVEVVAS